MIVGDNIKIRSDLESCDEIPAKYIDVLLPDPLKHLIGAVPDVKNLPYFETRTEAGVTLSRKVRAELHRSPKIKTSEDLVRIAQPLTMDMSNFKPTFQSDLKKYVPIKLSLSLTIIVFVLNLFLHIAFIWAYHRFNIIRKYIPSFLKHDNVRHCCVVKSDNVNEIHNVYQQWKNQYENFHFKDKKMKLYKPSLSRRSSMNMPSSKVSVMLSHSTADLDTDPDQCSSQVYGAVFL